MRHYRSKRREYTVKRTRAADLAASELDPAFLYPHAGHIRYRYLSFAAQQQQPVTGGYMCGKYRFKRAGGAAYHLCCAKNGRLYRRTAPLAKRITCQKSQAERDQYAAEGAGNY